MPGIRVERMRIGTPEHRDLFCKTFIDGHKPYEVEELPWPQLERRYLDRLRAIPFWGIARAMEHRAGVMVSGFADTIADPAIREAIALQGREEARHGRIMSHLVEHYGISTSETELPAFQPHRGDFVTFGYEECLDFFMGAGLFRLATELDYFPKPFVAIFEDVLFEEARHVTFFINWFRYEEARAGRDRFPGRFFVAARNYLGSLRSLIGTFTGSGSTGFAAKDAGALIDGLTPKLFLEAALEQHRKFLGRLDRRLVKPAMLPALATIALTVLRALPPVRKPEGLTLAERSKERSAAA